MNVTAEQIQRALQLAMAAQQALTTFISEGYPVLQRASTVIANMQQNGSEIPTSDDQKGLQDDAAASAAAADAAIKTAGG